MKNLIYLLLLSFVLLTSTSCKKDIESEHIEFIGTWEGDYTTLYIESDGSGLYDYNDGILTKSVDGRVVIKNDEIKFRVTVFGKKYSIDTYPRINPNDGMYYMVLDGETFIRY